MIKRPNKEDIRVKNGTLNGQILRLQLNLFQNCQKIKELIFSVEFPPFPERISLSPI